MTPSGTSLAKGSNKILLNLGDITYIDSSGIGELVSAFTTVKNGGGELKLLNLTKKVHDLLQITKLLHGIRRQGRRGLRQFLHSPSNKFSSEKAVAIATAFRLSKGLIC